MNRSRTLLIVPIAAIAAVAVHSGCAEDRILETDAVCGDGKQSGAEECDVASEGCVECLVTPGWHCNTETCETQCGDGVVTGEEQCDPPSPTSCDSACRSGTKSEPCDMTGYWISRETDFSVDNVVSQIQTSSNMHFYHFTQTGDAFVVDVYLFCGVQVSGSVDVNLSEGGLRGLMYRNAQDGSGGSHPARRGTFKLEGDHCVFQMDRWYNVRGVEDRFLPPDFLALPVLDTLPAMPFEDNPENKPDKPFGQNLEGATDDDGDGKPGVAWYISGNSNGIRNTAQRDFKEFPISSDYRIEPNSIEFVTRGNFENQENVLHVSGCPRLGCGLLTGKSAPARDRKHRVTLRYLGKELDEPRVAAIVVGTPKANVEDDVLTCANQRAQLPHDPTKE
jgi:hypothetical protein